MASPASRVLAAWVLVVAVLAAPLARGDCASLSTGIDRDSFVFYVEDGARADRIGAAWYDLEGRVGRAADWLKLAPYRDGDPAEAVVNARKTADYVTGEVARLRADLKKLPETGPSFPPVFYWPDGWMRLAFAVLDSLAIQAEYLHAEADALAAGDLAEVTRIVQARNRDLSGFDKYFSAFDRQMVELLPEDHPEHILMRMRVHWHGLFDLYAERDAETDSEAIREVSLKIVEKLNEVAGNIRADMPAFEKTLPGHRDRLAPFLLTLACDPGRAEAGLDRYMATYRAFLPLADKSVELLRDYARIEVDFLNNGASQDLYDRYDSVSFRYEAVVKAASEQWSERARILTGLIAKEDE